MRADLAHPRCHIKRKPSLAYNFFVRSRTHKMVANDKQLSALVWLSPKCQCNAQRVHCAATSNHVLMINVYFKLIKNLFLYNVCSWNPTAMLVPTFVSVYVHILYNTLIVCEIIIVFRIICRFCILDFF